MAPLIVPGTEGAAVTIITRLLAELVPQLLPAVTLTLPDAVPKVMVALVVPCPADTVPPAGGVQI
jgi:hypothetical protein